MCWKSRTEISLITILLFIPSFCLSQAIQFEGETYIGWDSAVGVVVLDSIAYVATERSGMYTLDFSDPANAKVIDVYTPISEIVYPSYAGVESIQLRDSKLLLGTRDNVVEILSLDDPRHPQPIGKVDKGYSGLTNSYIGSYTIRIDHSSSSAGPEIVQIFEISDPSEITLAAEIPIPGQISNYELVETALYIIATSPDIHDETSSLYVINLENPSQAFIHNHLSEIDVRSILFHHDSKLFCSSRSFFTNDDSLKIFNVENLYSPELLPPIPDNLYSMRYAIDGDIAYGLSSTRLTTFQILDDAPWIEPISESLFFGGSDSRLAPFTLYNGMIFIPRRSRYMEFVSVEEPTAPEYLGNFALWMDHGIVYPYEEGVLIHSQESDSYSTIEIGNSNQLSFGDWFQCQRSGQNFVLSDDVIHYVGKYEEDYYLRYSIETGKLYPNSEIDPVSSYSPQSDLSSNNDPAIALRENRIYTAIITLENSQCYLGMEVIDMEDLDNPTFLFSASETTRCYFVTALEQIVATPYSVLMLVRPHNEPTELHAFSYDESSASPLGIISPNLYDYIRKVGYLTELDAVFVQFRNTIQLYDAADLTIETVLSNINLNDLAEGNAAIQDVVAVNHELHIVWIQINDGQYTDKYSIYNVQNSSSPVLVSSIDLPKRVESIGVVGKNAIITSPYSVLHYTFDTDSVNISSTIPQDFKIVSVYPNPFNGWLNVEFETSVDITAEISIYNILGQKVANLSARPFSAGINKVGFDPKLSASGMYYICVDSPRWANDVRSVIYLK